MSTSGDLVRQASAVYHKVVRVPQRHTAVVTCIDTRLDPLRISQSGPGELHVLRNAGGVVTEDVVRSAIEADLGRLPFDLHGFADLHDELERGAARLRGEPLLRLPGGVATYIYDVTDGGLHRQSP